MEIQPSYYNKQEFVETASGNKVSRQSTLCGSQNIVLNGKTILMAECVIRGDLANVRMGRYCYIGRGAVIRPSCKKFSKGVAFIPVHVGDHVMVDEGAVVAAAQVGSFVHVGRGAIVGRRAILRDCSAVLDGAVVAPDAVVPPFAVVGGSPARVVAELPACTQELMTDATRSLYERFLPEAVAAATR